MMTTTMRATTGRRATRYETEPGVVPNGVVLVGGDRVLCHRVARRLVSRRALGEAMTREQLAAVIIDLANRFPQTAVLMVAITDSGHMNIGVTSTIVDPGEMFRLAADVCENVTPMVVVDGLGTVPPDVSHN